MKKLDAIFKALDFAKFSDRAIGNHFVKALNALEDDLTEREYEPGSEAEEAFFALEAEVNDALEKQAEAEPEESEDESDEVEKSMDDELINELDAEEIEEDDEDGTLEDEDEVEQE
jgi:hypothetical protein